MRTFHFSFLVTASLALLGHAKLNKKAANPALTAAEPDQLTLQIPIDHSNSSSATYANRYFVNATYYKSGGPVFVQDIGEQTVSDGFIQTYLTEAYGPAAVMQLAAKYNGVGILLEHRFYGQSLPFPLNQSTGIAIAGYDAYQFLTVEQALEDVVYLAEHFQPEGLSQYWTQLAPTQVPWIFLGGSYPGARAAWIRLRNPDVIFASWASSAPVQTTVDMSTYYEQVYMDMTANCSADLAAASDYLTTVYTSGSATEQALLAALALVATASNTTDYTSLSDTQIESAVKAANETSGFDLGEFLANFIGGGLQDYGFDEAVLPYCNYLEVFDAAQIDNSSIASVLSTTFHNIDDGVSSTKGIAATYGPQAAFLALAFAIYQETIVASESGVSDDDETAAELAGDAMSWQWQTCYELGYFQVANLTSPDNLLSSFVNVTSWEQNYCQAYFPYPQLPASPDSGTLVSKYGGWTMNPSQVMFTDGLMDPWHTLSTQSTSSTIGAPDRQTSQTVPACGAGAAGTNVFGLTFPNGYHASDLFGTASPAVDALALFEQALNVWIPCFQSHTITSNGTTAQTSPTSTSSSASASATKTGGAGGYSDARNAVLGGLATLLASLFLLYT